MCLIGSLALNHGETPGSDDPPSNVERTLLWFPHLQRTKETQLRNLHQKSNEAAIDFLIRVGTLVSNLAKDWKDELMEGELQPCNTRSR